MHRKKLDDKVPDTPLPPVGANGVDDHLQMSKRFQEHTHIEIGKRNRLQASEKIWASVAHALKAVAERRGWTHESHAQLGSIARQLGHEQGEFAVYDRLFDSVEQMHHNFYENDRDWDSIDRIRKDAELFIDLLKQDLVRTPTTFTIANKTDKSRLERLLRPPVGSKSPRRKLSIGDSSPVGFSPTFAYKARLVTGESGKPLSDISKDTGDRNGKIQPHGDPLPRQLDIDNPRA